MENCVKKAVILSAVPKSTGFTAEMLKLIRQTAPSNIEISDVNMFYQNILPCTDCGYCLKNDACRINTDDFDTITEKVKSADIVIVLTPVYFLSLPSPLKAYFDRMQRYFSQKFIRKIPSKDFPARKKGAVAVCCGAGDSFVVEVVSKTVKMMFDCINTQLCDVFSVMNTDKLHVSDISSDENMDKLKKFWENLI